ncbi:MAG: hypothetical protein PHS24_03660 [Bacilli bacterium]|nr:hypothetical protein [Bacilli bacterium]
MGRIKKINKFLKKLIYITLFLLLLGLSFAFFEASIFGSETSVTITGAGGTMDITFE